MYAYLWSGVNAASTGAPLYVPGYCGYPRLAKFTASGMIFSKWYALSYTLIVCRYIMFWAKNSPVPDATIDFSSRWPVMILSSTIAFGDITTAELDGDGLALLDLFGLALAAVDDRLGVGLAVERAAVFDELTAGETAGLLVAGAGAAAGSGGALLDAGGALLDAGGAAADEIAGADALVDERLAVQAVTSRAGASRAGASPSTAARASIRRMRAILPDPVLDYPHCRVRWPRFDPPDGGSVLLGVGALRACPFPRAVSQS